MRRNPPSTGVMTNRPPRSSVSGVAPARTVSATSVSSGIDARRRDMSLLPNQWAARSTETATFTPSPTTRTTENQLRRPFICT